tara:strand:- start:1425 stop:1868 length:444 start_codon:yes stop_codon:yes gene_type:complete
MGKLDVLKSIKQEWAQLRETVKTIPNYTFDIPTIENLWSTTDTLKHVAGWDEEVIKILRAYIASGIRREQVGAANINDRLLEARRNMDAREAWTHFQETHLSLISYLETLPEHVFHTDSYTWNWVACLVPQHYRDHRQDIENIISSL